MAQAGQSRRAQTSWECLGLEELLGHGKWMCSMATPGMGAEEEEREAGVHPHFCCQQCWGGEGLELFQGPLRAGPSTLAPCSPQPGSGAGPVLSKGLVWDK